MNIKSGAFNALRQVGLSVHPNVDLHPKKPLIPFFYLMRLRVSCTGGILNRALY